MEKVEISGDLVASSHQVFLCQLDKETFGLFLPEHCTQSVSSTTESRNKSTEIVLITKKRSDFSHVAKLSHVLCRVISVCCILNISRADDEPLVHSVDTDREFFSLGMRPACDEGCRT